MGYSPAIMTKKNFFYLILTKVFIIITVITVIIQVSSHTIHLRQESCIGLEWYATLWGDIELCVRGARFNYKKHEHLWWKPFFKIKVFVAII